MSDRDVPPCISTLADEIIDIALAQVMERAPDREALIACLNALRQDTVERAVAEAVKRCTDDLVATRNDIARVLQLLAEKPPPAVDRSAEMRRLRDALSGYHHDMAQCGISTYGGVVAELVNAIEVVLALPAPAAPAGDALMARELNEAHERLDSFGVGRIGIYPDLKHQRPMLLRERLDRVLAEHNIDVMQDDIGNILVALGQGDHARSASCHDLIEGEIIPIINAMRLGAVPAGGDAAGALRDLIGWVGLEAASAKAMAEFHAERSEDADTDLATGAHSVCLKIVGELKRRLAALGAASEPAKGEE